MLKRWLFLLLAIMPALAFAQNVHEFKLKNGMKVIVQEDHRSPVVVSQVWYRAGSMDEFNGTTGVAHVLEHMMFKGTKTVPAGQFSRMIAAAGGRENAFTGNDYTAYFQQLEKSRLPLALKLEADRMVNLQLSAGEFAKEINVVKEERRWRTDDNPQAQVYEQFIATAYQAHPYGRPIVGWMSDLESMKVGDARDWYRRWYAPNNATLVVVGDVDPKQVLRLAEQYFGPLKARPLPVRKPQAEPEQTGERRVTVKAPAKLPYVLMGFPVPVVTGKAEEWEPYALEILAGVLDGNASARLNRTLVRTNRIAVDVGAGYDMVQRGGISMFLMEGTPSEGVTVEDLEHALLWEADKIKQEGVSEEELLRVKAQVIAADVYQRDSVFYQAMQIGKLETSGLSWKLLKEYPEKLKSITAEQVRQVAQKYLVPDRMTVATLDPQPLDNHQPKQNQGAGHGHF